MRNSCLDTSPMPASSSSCTARANTGFRQQDGSGLQVPGLLCAHPAQRGARGCCLDLQANGERGPLREILADAEVGLSRAGPMGPWDPALGLHSNSLLCPLGLCVLESQLSECSFSKRDDSCCCVMHIVTSLLSVHTKDYCEKFNIQATKTQAGTLVCVRAFLSLGEKGDICSRISLSEVEQETKEIHAYR